MNKWDNVFYFTAIFIFISVLTMKVNEVFIMDVRDTRLMCVLVGNSSLCSVRNVCVTDDGILTFIMVHKAWRHDLVVRF